MLNKKLLGSVSAPPAEYVEDVFSTYLYTGNNSTQTITNGIDLAGEGGMVWIKDRSSGDYDHTLYDTERSLASLRSNSTGAQQTYLSGYEVDPFNNNGFTVNAAYNQAVNRPTNYVSWTFRKAPKFFDVVTYTGNGAARTIAHNLGSVPGMIIVKRTDTTGDWQVYHRANTAAPETDYLVLNTTAATADSDTRWNDTLPTSTVFSLGTDATVNANSGTYVAYLFAHDAGGFGDAGTDNIISCGSYTTDGSSNATINLGYEPQFLLVKSSTAGTNWILLDNMRGLGAFNATPYLTANANFEEFNLGPSQGFTPTATGFTTTGFAAGGNTFIYMAIRRPMKTPTSATSVFAPVARTGTGSATSVSVGFPLDLLMFADRTASVSGGKFFANRLVGRTKLLTSTNANAEVDDSDAITLFGNTTYTIGADSNLRINSNGTTYINWAFRRAPGFFDIVCYTGTGSNRTVAHNLGVAPELMIIKRRNGTNDWAVYAGVNTDMLELNTTAATTANSGFWNNTTPTSTVFSLGTNARVNANTGTYVAYLFATCAGVSKVGSYTGNGSSQTIDCGFTAGARFVLVKATSTTGDWVVLDTARGIVSGNDPFLQLNSTAAEVTNEDIVDPANSGFVVNSTTEGINTNGVTYIFLAIA